MGKPRYPAFRLPIYLTRHQMDQVPHPGPNWVFHVRANALFIVLWLIDITMLALAIESVVFQMSGIILFASEVRVA